MKNAIEKTAAILFCALLAVNMAWAGEAGTTMPDCQDWTTEEFWAAASASDVAQCFDNGPIGLETRDDEGLRPLNLAAAYGSGETVEALVALGANLNTALYLATLSDHTESAVTLIQVGANVSAVVNGRAPLIIATNSNNTEIAEALIQAGADATAADNDGWTPLHNSARWSNTGIVEMLIQAGADVNAKNDFPGYLGVTPLYIGLFLPHHIQGNAKTTVEALIRAGADVNVVNGYDGTTPLHIAVLRSMAEIVEILIQAGADVSAGDISGHTPLYIAMMGSDPAIIEALNRAGARIEDPDRLERPDCQDWATNLFWAVANISDVGRCFIDGPIELESRDYLGQTPLHAAVTNEAAEIVNALVTNEATEIVSALIEAGANVNTRANFDETPLHSAARLNNREIVEALIRSGADVNARNEFDETPLHYAAEENNTEIAEILIQAGADIIAGISAFGWTPLHEAIFRNSTEVVEALIRTGADVNAETEYGQTPLDTAIMQSNSESVNMLIQAGANVNAGENTGRTPLHYAVEQNNALIVESLAQAGARIDARITENDFTPLDLAEQSSSIITAILTRLYPLHLSVLPTSRSVLTGQQASVFATAINGSDAVRTDCGIHLNNAPDDLEFRYFLTDEQNRIIGEPNPMVTLDPGAGQSYLIELTSQTTLDSIELFPKFTCSEQTPNNPVSLLNSVTLSVEATPTLDIIAMASTTSNDGVLRGIPGEPLAFGVASSNLGAAGQVSVQARAIGAGASAADMLICQTDPTTGNCLAGAPEEQAIANLAADEVSTWTVLLVDSGQVPFNPAENRIMVEFFDDDGVRRGGTSVALSLMEN